MNRSSVSICFILHVTPQAWNGLTPHTLASGGDDSRLRVWDLRSFQQPVANFKHHR